MGFGSFFKNKKKDLEKGVGDVENMNKVEEDNRLEGSSLQIPNP